MQRDILISIQNTSPEVENVQYHVHLQYLIKQKKHVYIEEEIELRQAEFYKGVLVEDQEIDPLIFDDNQALREPLEDPFEDEERAKLSI